MTDKSLLQPSLESESSNTIHSIGALIATAFFGGAPAVVYMGGLNARRLGRLTRDLPWLLAALAATFAFWWFGYHAWSEDVRMLRFGNRALGFILVGVIYLVFRPYYRSMSALGREPPKPWVSVIIALLVGYAINFAIVFIIVALQKGGA